MKVSVGVGDVVVLCLPAKLPGHTVFDLYFSKSGWIL